MGRLSTTLLFAVISSIALGQAGPKVYESAGVRVVDGALIVITTDRYEAVVSRKSGTVMEVTSRGEPLFTDIHQFIMMLSGHNGRRSIRVREASFRELPAGVAIDLRGYSTGGDRAMRYEATVEALSNGSITVRTTLTPRAGEKARDSHWNTAHAHTT